MNQVETLSEPFRSLAHYGILIGSCFILGVIINFIFYTFIGIYKKRNQSPTLNFFYQYTQKPMNIFLPFLLIMISLPMLSGNLYYSLVYRIIYILFSASFAWLLIKLIYVLTDSILAHHEIDVKDNITQRKLLTQIQFIKRLLIIIVVLISISAILLNFESVRKFGAGILTSAGIAGIIIGFAAQRTIGNLLAGLQIAFSQPIRIDDVVIVEKEWGRVEEITLTYVIIKLWDLRRLVVPLNYFIEKPFENWTKNSADIIGSVTLFLNYNVPVEALKAKFEELLSSNPLWDGKSQALQIIGTTEKSLEVRAIMSARNAGDSWDLRCYVREELIKYIRVNYPDSLPTVRSEVNFHPQDQKIIPVNV